MGNASTLHAVNGISPDLTSFSLSTLDFVFGVIPLYALAGEHTLKFVVTKNNHFERNIQS